MSASETAPHPWAPPLISRVTVAKHQAHAQRLGNKAAWLLAAGTGSLLAIVVAQYHVGGPYSSWAAAAVLLASWASIGCTLAGLVLGWFWVRACAYWRYENDSLRLAAVDRIVELSSQAERFVDKVKLQDRKLTVGETRDLLACYGHLLPEGELAVL